MKRCSKCKIEKPFDEFYNSKNSRDGKDHYCKICKKQCGSTYRQNNPEQYKISAKKSGAKWNNKHKDRRAYLNKVWFSNNKDKMNQYYREYRKKRYKENISLRIANKIRTRIWRAMKGKRKVYKFNEYTGCTKEFLVEYLELKFQLGMTWNNYGKWHIDHIKPLSSFDLSDPVQQKQACHYTNLQPLWAKDNLKKGNKLLKEELAQFL